MTKPAGGSEVLKMDSRGRVRVTRERCEQLLVEFEKSGLSAPQFRKVTGLRYRTFAAWLQKGRRRRAALAPAAPGPSQPVEWLETVIERAQAPSLGVSSSNRRRGKANGNNTGRAEPAIVQVRAQRDRLPGARSHEIKERRANAAGLVYEWGRLIW